MKAGDIVKITSKGAAMFEKFGRIIWIKENWVGVDFGTHWFMYEHYEVVPATDAEALAWRLAQ